MDGLGMNGADSWWLLALKPESGRTGSRQTTRRSTSPGGDIPLSSVRTVTVGAGFQPALLTLPTCVDRRSRARAISRHHRRWGLPPRPENVRRRGRNLSGTDSSRMISAALQSFFLSDQRDGRKPAAVIRLFAEASAPIGKEAVGLRCGVAAAALDAGQPEPVQLLRHIAREVEEEATGAGSRNEERGIIRGFREEGCRKFRSDFVGGLGDAWADAGAKPVPRCTPLGHRLHCRIEYAGERAAPAGMGGADHFGF